LHVKRVISMGRGKKRLFRDFRVISGIRDIRIADTKESLV